MNNFNLCSFDFYEISWRVLTFSYVHFQSGPFSLYFPSTKGSLGEGLNPPGWKILYVYYFHIRLIVIFPLYCGEKLASIRPTLSTLISSSFLSFHSLNNGQLKVSRCNLTKWKASINFSNPNSPSC